MIPGGNHLLEGWGRGRRGRGSSHRRKLQRAWFVFDKGLLDFFVKQNLTRCRRSPGAPGKKIPLGAEAHRRDHLPSIPLMCGRLASFVISSLNQSRPRPHGIIFIGKPSFLWTRSVKGLQLEYLVSRSLRREFIAASLSRIIPCVPRLVWLLLEPSVFFLLFW